VIRFVAVYSDRICRISLSFSQYSRELQ